MRISASNPGTPETSKTPEFRKFSKREALMGTRCLGCGKLYCPPRAVCSRCLSDEVEWVELEGKGEVVTFTIISVPPTGFEEPAPYTVAIVRLDDGPKLTGLLTGVPPEEVKVGMRVETIREKVSGDKLVYRFRPIAC